MAISLAQQRVVAQQAGAQQRHQGGMLAGVDGQPLLLQATFRAVTDAAEVEVSAARGQLLHGHLVARQGAGLVRADYGRAAQCLDRRQAADDRVTLRHAPDADGQGDGEHRRQTLRDHRHRQCDSRHEHRHPGFPVRKSDDEG
jgi:hypothetical protein